MSTPVNLHWKFYVDYFNNPNRQTNSFDSLKEKNSVLMQALATDYRSAFRVLSIPNAATFCLHTTYPGLLVGSGYRHETGSQDELKLGFSFDFTTGLPILPGSSVKGLLRSAFPGNPDLTRNPMHERAKLFIRYLLLSIKDSLPEAEAATFDAEGIDIIRLEHELFEGQVFDKDKNRYCDMPMGARDIFYDGLIGVNGQPGVDEARRVYGGALFGNDFITPHRNRKNPKMSPFTNPVPIQFLKVMPNVPVTFQFALPDRPAQQLLTPGQRLKLYQAIISELGVGAKTRVGYGQLH